jgi:hypothetical protein
MSYPIVKDAVARQWYKTWTESCLDQKLAQRVNVESPAVGTALGGDDHDWPGIAAKVMQALDDLLSESDATFESEGAIVLHEVLPDDAALRDPEFWIWLATVPGRPLILKRYPLKEGKKPKDGQDQSDKPTKNPLPDSNNFFGSGAKETLFFRLWIRAEMGKSDSEDQWEFVRPGMIDFWRSHVFRQVYAHHRAFLHAFVDFQFPSSSNPDRQKAQLSTPKIRILAHELSLACANVVIETLNQTQCAALIQRVYEERVPKD